MCVHTLKRLAADAQMFELTFCLHPGCILSEQEKKKKKEEKIGKVNQYNYN